MKKINSELEEWNLRHRLNLSLKKKRRAFVRLRKYRTSIDKPQLKNLFGKRSDVIFRLAQHSKNKLQIWKNSIVVKIPSKLSIIDYPEVAIELACNFANTTLNLREIKKVIFNHKDLIDYDLAANALLDIVASELAYTYRVRGSRRRLRCEGSLPKKPEVKRFIRAIGIIKHLDIKHEAPSPKEAGQLKVFDSRRKYYSPEKRGTGNGKRDVTVARFVDHIDQCLSIQGRSLTSLGKQNLAEYLSEILNNAEDHAGFIDWTIQGYLDISATTPKCEIAIFNFGQSISESLGSVGEDSYTWKQIKPYLEMHEVKKVFGRDWRREDLLTVIALQPHVSSKNYSSTDSRGQGTVDLIQFFQTVFDECTDDPSQRATMAILSGSTYIKFDGTYRLSDDPHTGRRQIAFNKDNDLFQRPDGGHVRSLDELHFPGTIISIRFPLTCSSLVGENEIENNHEN